MDPESWTIGEIAAGLVALGAAIYGVSYIIRYLKWRYKAPKFESDNDDDIDKLGMC